MISISHDVLEKCLDEILEIADKAQEPIFIYKDGKPDLVLMNIDLYKEIARPEDLAKLAEYEKSLTEPKP